MIFQGSGSPGRLQVDGLMNDLREMHRRRVLSAVAVHTGLPQAAN